MRDLERTVAFYRDLLGFECTVHGEPPDFVVAKRDEAIVLLSVAGDDPRLVPNWHVVEKMWNVYVRLDDVRAFYAEVQERGCPIDYSLHPNAHGFLEFGVPTRTVTTSPSASPSAEGALWIDCHALATMDDLRPGYLQLPLPPITSTSWGAA